MLSVVLLYIVLFYITIDDHKHNWDNGYTPFLWKSKGRRNKEWAQVHFKGIGHHEQKQYIEGLENTAIQEQLEQEFKDEMESGIGSTCFNEDGFDQAHQQTPFILSDYMDNKNVDGFSPKRRGKKRKHPNMASSDVTFYGKDMVIYLKKETGGDSDVESEEDTEPEDHVHGKSLNDSQSFETVEANSSPLLSETLSVCTIDARSIQDFRTDFPDSCSVSMNCLPCRFIITLEGTPTHGEIILWQKRNLADLGIFVNEYW